MKTIPCCSGAPRSVLTKSEVAVLRLIGEGKTTKEIATLLSLSPNTVSTHRRSLCRKLDAHSTAELTFKACSSRGTPEEIAENPGA